MNKSDRFRKNIFTLPLQQISRIIVRVIYLKIKNRIDTIIALINLWSWGCETSTNITVAGRIRCNNYGKMRIGKNVTLYSGHEKNYVGADRKVSLWIGKGAELIIEGDVGVSNTTIIAFNSITIKKGTMIGGGCDIYDNDFHQINSDERKFKKGSIESNPIVIGPWAFIGAHTIIMKGVHIGEGSVVGIGSLVLKDVPDYEIWAGRPAKFIKKIERNSEV